MFDNNKEVVSNLVAITGNFATPETAQATWNQSNLTRLIKTTLKSSAEEAENALNKVRSTKKAFDSAKKEARKAINKATNIRNDALRKLNQAQEVMTAAKEDWETKVIIATKKIKELESAPEKRHSLRKIHQAKQQAEKARENFENKKFEVEKRMRKFEESDDNLEAVIKEQHSNLEAAEMAYNQAQLEQQKAILKTNNQSFAWGSHTQKHAIESCLKDNYGLQVVISDF